MHSWDINKGFTEMNAKISAAIIAHRLAGKSLREAFDAVLGAGSYEKLAGEVYDALNKAA